MDNQEQYFKLVNDNGEEQLCRIVLTFDNNENEKSYVLFTLVDENGNESEEITALTFELDENDEMINFSELETEAEWAIVNEVLATIVDELEEEGQFFTIIDENDEELDCEIIHTFELDEFGKHYVLYVIVSDEPLEGRDIFAATYTPGENGEIAEIHPIETDEEWEKVEAVLTEL